MEISNSYDLLVYLKKLDLLHCSSWLWWENSGEFEVILGAILTQNTKWSNVELVLKTLRDKGLLCLESIASLESAYLAPIIIPCGFHNQKSSRIIALCRNIIAEFGDLESFKGSVTREWLLSQKGLGNESVDCILNYFCFRDVIVVDKYTQKLLSSFGFEFYEYNDIANWLESGIIENYDNICKLYGKELEIFEIYARLHGKIVEYGKLQTSKCLV